jgi:uncharacterized protein
VALVAIATIAVVILAGPTVPEALRGLRSLEVEVGGRSMRVVVAADHATGLMGIADLGGVDGMLFEYPADVDPAEHRFWMQGVLIPLDIAFFDGDGLLVTQTTMPLCSEADQTERTCPLFAAEGRFRWALETEAGSFRFEPGARLDLAG